MPRLIETVCQQCHQHKMVANGLGKFCSIKCSNDWQRDNVKRKLFEEGKLKLMINSPLIYYFLEERDGRACSCCKLTEWVGKPIPLDVDHIDGNNKNNLPKNLRFLCPNCHRQTDTWGNKKRQSLRIEALRSIDIAEKQEHYL